VKREGSNTRVDWNWEGKFPSRFEKNKVYSLTVTFSEKVDASSPESERDF